MTEDPKNGKSLYRDVIEEADLKASDRKAIVKGRSGKSVPPRCYHMKPAKLDAIKAKIAEGGRFVSPFRRGGAYWGVVEALCQLGENQQHLFKDVMTKMREVMETPATKDKDGKTSWDRFTGRAPRNSENARDLVGKVLQNIEVLQRLGGNHPYGYKLSQMGACINLYKRDEDGVILVELRTGVENPSPVNQRRNGRKGTVKVETDEKTVETVEAGSVPSA